MPAPDARSAPIPPEPNTTPPILRGTEGKGVFEQNWLRWFGLVRTKINILNESIVNLSSLTGTGILVKNGAQWLLRQLVSGFGITISNPDGIAGNPTIEANLADLDTIYQRRAQFFVIVRSKADLPTPVSGVITLVNDTTYFITTSIDLTGDRIVTGSNNAIIGSAAENCFLFSTGLTGTALITGTSSLAIRFITITADIAFDLNNAMGALDWYSVRLVNCPTVGTIQNYANIVWLNCAISNSANLVFTGTQASIAFTTCLFDGRAGQTTITIPSAAIITRRFRMLYCALIVDATETGIDFSTSATVPDESYILDNCNFAGAGTYLAGLDYTSNKASFFNNVGITNTTAVAQYSMTGNATTTVIGAVGTFVKIEGTTVPSSILQKFDLSTSNRALYQGASPSNFRVLGFASMTSGNNQDIRLRIALNGTTLTDSTSKFRTTGSGEAASIGVQTLVSMNPTDYIEMFVTNDTATTNITVSDMNLIIARLN